MSVLTAEAPPAETSSSDPPSSWRRRLAFWRSPEGQPRWARPALLGIAALAVALFAWNLRSAGYALFYSTAVKSMSVSWKAFFYGALDPGATITIDKLAGSFLPQALSARIFGFHQWSLALPQVIEGVVAVLAMYRVTRRWVGERLGSRGAAVAGLLSAGIFGLTPIIASMFGHAMEDGALTMCLVLAVDAYQRAVNQGRLRALMLAGVWVGLAFQCKMLQAWIIVPALGIGYLLFAPVRLRRRVVHLVAAGAVLVAVSLSWVMLYTVTPAKDRPYVDGSSNNSAVAMVFGYNGLERFGIHIPGSLAAMGGKHTVAHLPAGSKAPAQPPAQNGQPPQGQAPQGQAQGRGQGQLQGSAGSRSAHGKTPYEVVGGPAGGSDSVPAKLLGSRFGPQIGWLYPLALGSLVMGLWWFRRSKRIDRMRAGFVMWGIWAATTVAVLSAIEIPHTAYVATLAPPLAALSAVGIVLAWRAFRAPATTAADGRNAGRGRAWALPVLVVAEMAWAVYLSRGFPSFVPWLAPAVIGAGAASLAAMAVYRWRRRRTATGDAVGGGRRLLAGGLTAGLAVGVAAMLLAPAVWAASVLDPSYAGSAFDASAGPSGMGGMPGVHKLPGTKAQPVANMAGGPGSRSGGTLTAGQRRLLDYVTSRSRGARYPLAVDDWNTADPYITAAGARVLPMGGFSGSVPQPTLARFKQLVAGRQVRYVLVSGRSGMVPGMAGSEESTVSGIDSWVKATCTAVPSSAYGGDASSTPDTSQNHGVIFAGGGGPAGSTAATLYRCS